LTPGPDFDQMGAREKIEVPMYEGNLDVEEFLNWISSLDKYFDYEEINDENKVKHVVTRLKGHAALWWDESQDNIICKGKSKIKSSNRMVAKFIPKYYQINIFMKLQNLR
jgi:hypothetical protein